MSEDTDIITLEEVPTIELSEAISIKLDGMTPAEKDNQLTIMFMLLQHESFEKYVDEKFDIHQSVDHEAKKIHTAVIEKPTVVVVEHKSPELGLDTAKSLKAHMYLKSVGCPETAKVVRKLYEIFGGTDEDNAIVESATDSDVDKELDAIKIADKFKV